MLLSLRSPGTHGHIHSEPQDSLGAETRVMLIQRLPELNIGFIEADPAETGFVSVYDFRQALYVNAAIDYETTMRVSKVTEPHK